LSKREEKKEKKREVEKKGNGGRMDILDRVLRRKDIPQVRNQHA
jgi:hypothetical protein